LIHNFFIFSYNLIIFGARKNPFTPITMDFRFLTIESQQQGVIAFIAVVLFQMLFVVVQWILHRRVDFSYYLFYLFTVVLYAVSLYRHILNIGDIFPLGEWLLEINIYPLPLLSVFFYFRFQRSFLELSIHNPELNLVVCKLERFILTYCIVAPLLVLAGVNGTILYILFVTVACVTIITSLFIVIKFLKKKIPLEQFSIIGAIFIISGSLVTVVLGIQEKQLTPLIVNPHLPLMVCALAELFTFTTGLTYKSYLIEMAKVKSEKDLLVAEQKRQKMEIQYLKMRNDVTKNLHDKLGSSLSLAKLLIERIDNSNRNGDSSFVSNSVRALDDAIKSLHQIINNLKSDTVEPYDCVNSINQMIAMLKPINNIVIHFNHNLDNHKISVYLHDQLSHIILELINNSLKHAKATNISIDLMKHNEMVKLKYVDNGKGLDLLKCNFGNGLRNIAERVSGCMGTLNYLSEEGKGFVAKIEIENKIQLTKLETA